MDILNSMNLDTWHTEITCDACESRLRIFCADVQVTEMGGDYAGEGTYIAYFVTCAACQSPIILRRGDTQLQHVPLLVRKDADRRRLERLDREARRT